QQARLLPLPQAMETATRRTARAVLHPTQVVARSRLFLTPIHPMDLRSSPSLLPASFVPARARKVVAKCLSLIIPLRGPIRSRLFLRSLLLECLQLAISFQNHRRTTLRTTMTLPPQRLLIRIIPILT